MMTGGNIPAFRNFNNVYARYDANSGEFEPQPLDTGARIYRPAFS